MVSLSLTKISKKRRFKHAQEKAWDYLKQSIIFRDEHALLYAPVLLGTGIGLYFSFNFEPSWRLIFNLWIGSLIALVLSQQLYQLHPQLTVFRIVSFTLCLTLSGLFLAQNRTISVYSPILQEKLQFADVTGIVQSIDILPEGKGRKITLTDLFIEELSANETPKYVRLTLRGKHDIDYQTGQLVEGLAALNPPSSPIAPGAFDFKRQSYFNQLGAIGFFYNPPDILKQSESNSFHQFWEDLRLSITLEIQRILPQDLQGVMITFMTGEKSSIPKNDLNAMRDSGLAHLLAISGLHVGLVAGFVFFFMRLGLASIPSLALQYPIKKWAAGCALVFAFFYMFLVGASVPTQRAMMMTGIALFAIMIDRSPFSLRMVALAALIILISYPEVLVLPSFQMSFAAVTALVAFYDTFRPNIQSFYRDAGIVKRGLFYILGIAMTTIIAGTATAIFGIYHFQSWSLYSTFANIFAMPVMGTLVMPLAVLSYILMPFGLADIPVTIMGQGVAWVLYVAHYVSEIEGAVINIAAFSPLILGLLVLGILCIINGPKFLRLLGAFVVLGVFLYQLTSPVSDRIFVSDDGKLVGVYQNEPQKFYVTSFRSGRYVRDNWARRLAVEKEDIQKLSEADLFQCGSEGCRFLQNDIKIAIPKTDYALHQDCEWADILITNLYAGYKCRAQTVIDKNFLKTSGATEIVFLPEKFNVQTVSDARGMRPWH